MTESEGVVVGEDGMALADGETVIAEDDDGEASAADTDDTADADTPVADRSDMILPAGSGDTSAPHDGDMSNSDGADCVSVEGKKSITALSDNVWKVSGNWMRIVITINQSLIKRHSQKSYQKLYKK